MELLSCWRLCSSMNVIILKYTTNIICKLDPLESQQHIGIDWDCGNKSRPGRKDQYVSHFFTYSFSQFQEIILS